MPIVCCAIMKQMMFCATYWLDWVGHCHLLYTVFFSVKINAYVRKFHFLKARVPLAHSDRMVSGNFIWHIVLCRCIHCMHTFQRCFTVMTNPSKWWNEIASQCSSYHNTHEKWQLLTIHSYAQCKTCSPRKTYVSSIGAQFVLIADGEIQVYIAVHVKLLNDKITILVR